MNTKKTTAAIVFLTALGITTPALSQNRALSMDRNHELNAGDTRVEYLNRSQIEEDRWNAYLDESDRRQMNESQEVRTDSDWETNSLAARFINEHPDLGCLYYDENDIRHWQPNCRE